MRRWLLLAAAPGCAWLSPGDLRARFDADQDGVPGSVDCDDTRPGVADFGDAEAVELACGATVDEDGGADDLLDVSNCLHPLADDQLADYGVGEWIYALPVAANGRVRFSLWGERSQTPGGDQDPALQGVFLFVWEGSSCEPEACTPGLPVARDDGNGLLLPGDDQPVTAEVAAEAGDLLYVVVTGDPDGEHHLRVECDPPPPPDP